MEAEKKDKDALEHEFVGCLWVLVKIPLMPLFAVWRGFVLSILWLWFIVPLGAPQIGIAHCIGISGLLSMLIAHLSSRVDAQIDKEQYTKAFVGSLISATLTPPLFLLFGYIVHKFM